MTIDEEKQQLRATIRRLSAQLPFRYREAADRAIARHLLALPEYRSAGAVFCFVSAGREIDTRPILEQTLADGKMLCVPLCVADGIMELRAIRETIESVRNDKYATITEVYIKGYASPEGTYANNAYLAENRARLCATT